MNICYPLLKNIQSGKRENWYLRLINQPRGNIAISSKIITLLVLGIIYRFLEKAGSRNSKKKNSLEVKNAS